MGRSFRNRPKDSLQGRTCNRPSLAQIRAPYRTSKKWRTQPSLPKTLNPRKKEAVTNNMKLECATRQSRSQINSNWSLSRSNLNSNTKAVETLLKQNAPGIKRKERKRRRIGVFERDQQIHLHNHGGAGAALEVSAQKDRTDKPRGSANKKLLQNDDFENNSPSGPTQIRLESISPKSKGQLLRKRPRKLLGNRSRSCDVRLTPKPLKKSEFLGPEGIITKDHFIKPEKQNANIEKTASRKESLNTCSIGKRRLSDRNIKGGLLSEETSSEELREGFRGKTFSVLTAETRGTITSEEQKKLTKKSKLKVLKERTLPERKSRVARLNKTQKIFLTFEGTLFFIFLFFLVPLDTQI